MSVGHLIVIIYLSYSLKYDAFTDQHIRVIYLSQKENNIPHSRI